MSRLRLSAETEDTIVSEWFYGQLDTVKQHSHCGRATVAAVRMLLKPMQSVSIVKSFTALGKHVPAQQSETCARK